MKPVALKTLAALAATFLLEAGAAGPLVQTVDVTGHRTRFDGPGPAAVRYLLVDPGNADMAVNGFAPIATRAVLLLFTGGDGRLGFAAGTTNLASTNFVVRTRLHFAAEGFVVAVVDAANDFLAHQHADILGDAGYNHGPGLKGHRLPGELYGPQHALDLAAVMADLRARYPRLPLWAVGTSRGTLSAAVAAVAVPLPVNGLVLTSSLTGPDAFGDLGHLPLEAVTVPTLIVTHKDDGCANTRPEDSRALARRLRGAKKVQVLQFEGGSAPLSNPCDPLDAHGFFGVEQPVIDAIARWILQATK